MLAAFLTTILFSLSAVSGQKASRLLGGVEANFWRLLFAAVLLALYAHSLGQGVGGASFHTFLLSGCIGFGLGDAALFQALPRIGSRLSVMLVLCLSAPVAALMEWLWLGTRLTHLEILCSMVIIGGVALALTSGQHLELRSRAFIFGVIAGIIAAICQAVGAVLSRRAFSMAASFAEDIDGITAAYQRIIGGVVVTAVFLLIIKFISGKKGDAAPRSNVWRQALPLVLINGLTGPALGVSCYQWALKTTPTGIVLPIVAMTPVVIIPFSRYLEGERASGRSIVGGIIAVLAAAFLAWLS